MLNLNLFSYLEEKVEQFDYKNKEKQLGQIFTPKWIVKLILDEINYIEDIFNKKILEPSCGNGAFLCVIVERYIKNALKNNIDLNLIKKGLENNIIGIEIDKSFFKQCIENLNIVAKNYNIYNVNWKILNEDSLRHNFKEKFDFIIGNPPYVRVHNLELSIRQFLKNNYSFCNNGTTDLYYAFYEKAILDINNNGKVAFITPNSFMRNGSGKILRNHIINNNLLEKLINFEEFQIFDNASVYSAIMVLSKNNKEFNYYNFINNNVNFVQTIKSLQFKDNLWNFSSDQNLNFLKKIILNKDNQKNIKVQNGFATLCDKLYISNNIKELDDNYILFNEEKIEKDITKLIVKANKYNGEEIKTRIIFPYQKINNKYSVIPTKKMEENFPLCYKYFLKNKELFLKRNLDSNWQEWYQFGRNQSIQTIHQKKIIVNNVVKDNIRFYELNNDVMVYSGLFITADDFDFIKKKLSDRNFIKYIKIIGKDMKGGYKSFNSQNLYNFLTSEIKYE